MESFKVGNATYQIKLTYGTTISILPEKFGIHINRILSDGDAAQDTLTTLVLDDEKCLRFMYYWMESTTSQTYEAFLDSVTTSELDAFREAFWSEVVNFSGSLKKKLMLQLWSEFKRDLKDANLTKSEPSPSTSSPEE